MKKVSAKTAKDFLGLVLSAAQREPITIEQNGQAVAVIVSPEDYLMLEALEHAYLELAEQAFSPESIKDFEVGELPLNSQLVN